MKSTADSTRSTEFILLCVAFIWAANYPLTKYGLLQLDIFVFNSIRFIVAFCLLWIMLRTQSQTVSQLRSDWKPILRLGILISIIYQCAFIIGIKHTSSGNAAVILSTSPLWTAFSSARINKERIMPQTWLGLIISLTGVVCIIIGSGKKFEIGIDAILGDMMILLSAILWGLNTTLQKPLLTRYTTIQLSVMTLGIGMIGLTVIAIPSAFSMPWRSIPYSYYLAAILSGALSIGTANVLWSYGVKKIGPSRTSNFNNMVPIFAFIIAYIALGETVAPLQIVGALVTMLGVWIVRR